MAKYFLSGLILILTLSFCNTFAQAKTVKRPDFSGVLYPAKSQELNELFGVYREPIAVAEPSGSYGSQVLIVPNASLLVAGQVALYGFEAVKEFEPETIVILADSHHHYLENIHIFGDGSFVSPLGNIKVDRELTADIAKNMSDIVKVDPDTFYVEHAIETMLPYVRYYYPETPIVPVLCGNINRETIDNLSKLITYILTSHDNVLLLVSGNLSINEPYSEAILKDERLIESLESFSYENLYTDIIEDNISFTSPNSLLAAFKAAHSMGLESLSIHKYANSGNITGNKDSVVGYLSATLYKENI